MRCHPGVAVVLAGLLGSGCPIFDPGFDLREVREDPGPTLARDAAFPPVFSADGAELIYVGRGEAAGALRAIRLADGSSRLVDTAIPDPGATLAPTTDGRALYTIVFESTLPAVWGLREVYSGTSIPLDPAPFPGLVVVDPSGRRLLVSTEGGVKAVDLDGGAVTATPCDGDIAAAFSPAGDEVVCQRRGGSNALVRFRLADQATTILPGLEGSGWVHALRWGPEGPSAALYPHLVVGDPAAGTVKARVSPRGRIDIGWNMAFSVDGRLLAYEESECLAGSYFGCSRTEYRVMLLDLATGATSTIASGIGVNGGVALAPDGRAVAYVLGIELHVRPIGR